MGTNDNKDAVPATTDLTSIDIPEDELALMVSDETGEQPTDPGETGKEPPAEKGATDENGNATGDQKKTTSDDGKSSKHEFTHKDGDGKETKHSFSNEELDQIVHDHLNDTNWKKANTDKAEEIAADRTKLEADQEQLKADRGKLDANVKGLTELVADQDVMEALDEHYQVQGKKNPLRELNKNGQKPSESEDSEKTELLKRIEALEKSEADNKVAADKEAKEAEEFEQAKRMAKAEIDRLAENDPDSLKTKDGLNEDNIQKIIKYADDYNQQHKDDEDFVPMSLDRAWWDVFGRVKAGMISVLDNATDAGETTSKKSPGVKDSDKPKKPKDMDEAADNALKAYKKGA